MKIEQIFTESDLSELEQALVKSMTPTNCVMRFWPEHKKAKLLQKYREPFVVVVEEKNIHYGESDFLISSIDHIVEYKYFLFIRADKRWYFIKAEEEEKAKLLSKLNSNSNITFTKIEEPFDLQQYIAFMEIMQIQERNRIKKYILLFIVLAAITILFFAGEKMLPDGWYYIPDTAIKIASVLCLLWQGVLIIGAYALSKRFIRGVYALSEQLNMPLSGWFKSITNVITVAVTSFLVLFLAWNLLLYSISFTVKVEQYDKHIALYVENTFVRTRFRYPHYMYEENWLFMRKLSDDELSKSIWKYGNPEDYYSK